MHSVSALAQIFTIKIDGKDHRVRMGILEPVDCKALVSNRARLQVLNFLSECENQPLRNVDIGQGCGYGVRHVINIIQDLLDAGAISRVKEGRLYKYEVKNNALSSLV